MPYFERKPWAETVNAAVAQPAPVPEVTEDAIGDIARTVLREEQSAHAGLEGPYRVRKSIAPGGDGHLTLEFSADSGGQDLTLDLAAGDLSSRAGAVLPSFNVSISPRTVKLSPGGRTDVRVSFNIPLGTPAGLYAGRLLGSGSETVAMIVEVEVSA